MQPQTVISSRMSEKAHILVIHPDPKVTKLMQQALNSEGYHVTIAREDIIGSAIIHNRRPDLVILSDTSLSRSKQEIFQRLRATQSFTPVIAVAPQESQARIAMLDAGADDCISQPSRVEELLARIRARLRRVDRSKSQVIKLGNLMIDQNTRQVHVAHQEIELTAKEFDLLLYLEHHAGQVMTKKQILAAVWKYEFIGTSNIVEVYARYLRRKLAIYQSQQFIQTIRSVGYTLRSSK